ncbi:hypothetical protein LCGC14_1725160 [marine sediment metagenome]|uniref:Replication protein n=1 Tax=marine sediment metagenome TaxID=412755 RepID=A0A0F9HBB9_9ZZZZ
MQTLLDTELSPPPELAVPATEDRWSGSRSYRKFAFGSMLDESEIRIDALRNTRDEAAWKIAVKISKCCVDPIVVSENSGEKIFLAEQRCKSRICPRCAWMRSRSLANRISELVHDMDSPRFLTLTVRSNDQSLRNQLMHLRRKFASMRRTELWGYHVRGGVYTIEITFNAKTKQWHPHLHAIIDGGYFPHAELLNLWESLVGDQCGVDIRLVVGVRKLANYLAAYVSKSCDLDHFEPEQLAEWAVETHGLRLAQTFGSLHANKVAEEEEETSYYRTINLDVNMIVTFANAGSDEARTLLNHLTGNRPMVSVSFEEAADDFMNGKRRRKKKPCKPRNLQYAMQF